MTSIYIPKRKIERRKNRGAAVPTLYLLLEAVALSEIALFIYYLFGTRQIAFVLFSILVIYFVISPIDRYFKVLGRSRCYPKVVI
jgi:hypothetical protein